MTNQISDNTTYTLAEAVDRFMVRISVDRKKNFGRYLILAEECWQDIFQNTLWVIKSVWLPTKGGNPYNFVRMPSDCARLLSVGVNDKCGLIQPLFYNSQMNVIAKPTTKKCGCSCSTCSGLCDSVASTVQTSELMFTVSGVNYYKTCWIKFCPNGDIIKFCRTPVKKYNNMEGDPGDYSPQDYMNDWLIGNPPFSDYTIVYLEEQEKVCHLDVAPCGCPIESEKNEDLFLSCCGMWVNPACYKKKYCKQFAENINSNFFGEIKVSECNTKIYYRPAREWRNVYTQETPDYLLVNYQTTGVSCGSETIIPKYAINLMYSMIDLGRKEYNSSFSLSEKIEATYKVTAEKQKIMAFLSPVSLEQLSAVQDIRVAW